MSGEYNLKRKRKERLILMSGEQLEETIAIEVGEIRKKLKKIFKTHIGYDESITPFELFYKIYNINPQTIDIYKRTYLYNIIKKILTEMRNTMELFVINNGYSLYVLKTEEEKGKYKEKINKHIDYLNNMKEKADKWVREEKWRNI